VPDLYEIVDPQPIAASAPHTFFPPSSAWINAVREGDFVKVAMRPIPLSDKVDAERMWLRIAPVRPRRRPGWHISCAVSTETHLDWKS
jgi:hypothetical protein